jgi:hypothetical protein
MDPGLVPVRAREAKCTTIRRLLVSQQRSRSMIEIPAVIERCAGIDIGKRELAVALVVGPPTKMVR